MIALARMLGITALRGGSALGWVALLVATLSAAIVRAQSDEQPFARVIVEHAVVRAGPGLGFRKVYLAERGDVFPLLSRATQGYWFRIELPDSTQGWVAGDAVHPRQPQSGEEHGGAWLPWLFAPPPLIGARGEIAIDAGVLGGGGMFAVRPSVLLDPAFGVEMSALAAVATKGRLWMLTAGPIINLVPRFPIVPFATVQGGITTSHPNADSFLLESGSIATLGAGIGVRIGFHYRLTLRLEARSHLFFEPDRTVAQEEFSAGLTVMF
jgi:hypothetical protein